MKTLLIEDDYYFGEEIVGDLENAIPSLKGSFDIIRTEQQFKERLQGSEPLQFGFIILDVMLTWDNQSGGRPPAEVVKGGYFEAGIRCLKQLREHPSTRSTPVIVHSARDTDQILQNILKERISMDGVTVVPKSGDPEPLVSAVRQLQTSPDVS